MTNSEILRESGLSTLLDNVDNNLIGRMVLKAMELARRDERLVNAGKCEQRACCLPEGAAVARQCALDILNGDEMVDDPIFPTLLKKYNRGES